MFSPAALAEGISRRNDLVQIPPPVGGLNSVNALASMPITDAVTFENWFAYPDRVEMRPGATDWTTGFANNVKSLHNWAGPSSSKLWATTDAGVYDATSSGAVGAAAIALTNGYTQGCMLATGGANYLTLVNGTDSAVQYDGAAWAAVAAFGAVNTNTLVNVETYKQRLYFIQKNTMNLQYLAANSVAGAATAYSLGALFRKGGYLVGIGTWTIDGGAGSDDYLVVASSEGELAVFTGTDPSAPAAWALVGVYYIGRPLGYKCFFKYGGDLLFLSETGIYPLSKALLAASIDRTKGITEKIRQLFTAYVALYRANEGWQIEAHPDVPMIIVNIPTGGTTGIQLAMHAQTGAWSQFTGWAATCFARNETSIYFGTGTKTAKAWTGYNDFGASIVATLLQAYTKLKSPRQKFITMARAMFSTNSRFTAVMGFDQDFLSSPTQDTITYSAFGSGVWGTSLWGVGIWGTSGTIVRDWRAVPDRPSTYKALYLQISSNVARVGLESVDLLISPQGTF